MQEFKKQVYHERGFAAAEKMRQLLRAVGTEEFANKKWGYKGAPNKGTIPNADFTLANEETRSSNY